LIIKTEGILGVKQQKKLKKLPHQERHISNPFKKSYPKRFDILVVIEFRRNFEF
jgi:hypothetical protein